MNEEILIKEAVHEAMEKAESQTSSIVKQAVRDAVSKAASEIKDGTHVTSAVERAASEHDSKVIAQARASERKEMRHISIELSKELGGLLDEQAPSKVVQDAEVEPDARETLSNAVHGGLTYKQVKTIDPQATRSQFHWLKWVQSQLRGDAISSTPYDAPVPTKVAKTAHAQNRVRVQAETKMGDSEGKREIAAVKKVVDAETEAQRSDAKQHAKVCIRTHKLAKSLPSNRVYVSFSALGMSVLLHMPVPFLV